MTTRVDFYLLPDIDDVARRRFTCRLVGRAVAAGKRVHVRAASEVAEAMDELLWEYPRDRFLPHARFAPENEHALEPVIIGAATDKPARGDVLVNLADGIPDCITAFERVAELVLSTERANGRALYRQYRERGYPLFHHEIDDWE